VAELLRTIVLASASPRRRALLAEVGIHVVVAPVDADESRHDGEPPADYVARVASAKLAIALDRASAGQVGHVVLAADTIVSVDGDVLGKPEGDDDARRILRRLSGRQHEVTTAVAIAIVGEVAQRVQPTTTRVRFRDLDEATIDRYVATGEGRDKAGSYGIQGIASGFVASIEGSYTNVVGLPVAETLLLLQAIGAVGAWP